MQNSGRRLHRCTCAGAPALTNPRVLRSRYQSLLYLIPFFDFRSCSLDFIHTSNLISPSKFTSKTKLLWRIDIFRGSSFELGLPRGYRATGRLFNWTNVQLADITLIFKDGMYKLLHIWNKHYHSTCIYYVTLRSRLPRSDDVTAVLSWKFRSVPAWFVNGFPISSFASQLSEY